MSLRTTTQTSPLGLISYKTGVPVLLSQTPSTTPSLRQPLLFMTLPAAGVMSDVTEKSLQRPKVENEKAVEAHEGQTPQQPPLAETEQGSTCVVCGEDGAKMHYNVLACLGCKGFFRRALKKADQYECINDNKCVINKYARNSCRACRLKKCLEAGMDPAAVRPDRDFIGKQNVLRLPQIKKKPLAETPKQEMKISKSSMLFINQEDLTKKLPVEMRTMLMTLLNIEIKISRGDTLKDARDIYPLHINTIKELIDNPLKLKGKRTEMRYEPYRMAKNEELSMIVYRRLIAAIDWVDLLSEMIDGLSTDDRIALVKSCYAPLLLFKCSARTAMVTEKENILCLCNFAYVPKNMAEAYSDAYHLDNGLVDRLINELVLPFRKLQLKEEEIVCLSAIIVLNPMAKDLSEDGIKKVSGLRDKIQDTLFQFIKEGRGSSKATSQFGNFLLYLPILANLANVLCENLRFAQTFSTLGSFPLLTSLFGCFPVEPFLDSESENERKEIIRKNVEIQTDPLAIQQRGIKRRLPTSFVSPVENESSSESREFRLLRPPCSYTLTEMFEDRMNEDPPSKTFQLNPQMTWPPRQQVQLPSSFSKSGYCSFVKESQTRPESTQIRFPKNQIPIYKHSIQNPCVSSGHEHQQCETVPSDVDSTTDSNQTSVNPYQFQNYFNFSNLPVTTIAHSGFSPTPPIENLSFEHREKFENL